jgi:hypothetical protein
VIEKFGSRRTTIRFLLHMTLNVEFYLIKDIIHSFYSFVAMDMLGNPLGEKKNEHFGLA